MSWFRKKESPEAIAAIEQLEKLENLLSVPAEFEDAQITFIAPAEFTKVPESISRGELRWRDAGHTENHEVITFNNKWKKGAKLLPHKHNKQFEYIYVLTGRLRVYLETQINEMRYVDLDSLSSDFRIEPGQGHWAEALTDCQFIVKFVTPERLLRID